MQFKCKDKLPKLLLKLHVCTGLLYTMSHLILCRERSGRVPDSRRKGRRFEPHGRHCVVVLEQDTFILA